MKKVVICILLVVLLTGCSSDLKEDENVEPLYNTEEVEQILNEYYSQYYQIGGMHSGGDFDIDYWEEPEQIHHVGSVYFYGKTGKVKSVLYGETRETSIEEIIKELDEREKNASDNNLKKTEAGGYDFNKNILIGLGFEMILKSDGSIIAKGRNNNGELGNGTLMDSESWIEVPGISDVKQIAYEGDGQMCTVYALKEDGTVWWWGSEQVSPIKIEGLNNVKELMFKEYGDGYRVFNFVYAHLNDNTILRLSNDKINVVEELEGVALDDFSLGELVSNSYYYYIYIIDGKAYYIDGIDKISVPLETEQTIKKVFNYRGNHYIELLTTEGERLYYSDGEKSIKSNGGNNVSDYYSTMDYHFSMLLFADGKISSRGENENGELGNGTKEPYESQWWDLDIQNIEHLFTPLNNKIYAIDKDNNLWAWGIEFTAIPSIQYNIDEIVSNY